MHRPFLFVVVLAVSLLAVMWGYSAFMAPYPAGGWWGMMGPNMMTGPGMWGGYGPGMMRGYGPGFMNPGWNTANLNLSTDDVKNYLDRRIAWEGNPRLKVGDVKEKDADTIVADIVPKDNSLVQRFVVNRRNGFFQPAGD